MCALISKAHAQAFTCKNIVNSFRKAGVYPLNSTVMGEEVLAPSNLLSGANNTAHKSGCEVTTFLASRVPQTGERKKRKNIRHQDIGGKAITESPNFKRIKNLPIPKTKKQISTPQVFQPPFKMDPRPILEALANGGDAVTSSPSTKGGDSTTVAGSPSVRPVINLIIGPSTCPSSPTPGISALTPSICCLPCIGEDISPPMNLSPESKSNIAMLPFFDQEEPGPSHINLCAEDPMEETSLDEDEDDEVCCQCNKFSPDGMRNRKDIKFVSWAQCSACGHWCHLHFCTSVESVGPDDEFLCPCHN